MTLVSVVIPTFNRSHLIRDTLDSVLSQSYPHLEIIVVDDGSTDNTLNLLSEYGQGIRVIHQSNQGEGSARNTGIRESKGEYVSFVDSDDLWLPNKIEAQIDLISRYSDLKWVYSDAEFFDGTTGNRTCLSSQVNRLYAGNVLRKLFLEDFIPSPTPLIHRDIFDEVGGFGAFPRAADWDMWLRIAARYPVGLVAKPLARYRIHPGMITATQDWRCRLEVCTKVIDAAAQREPEQLEPIRDKAIARLNIGLGRGLVSSGELTDARMLFREAIYRDPTMIKPYAYYLASYLGIYLLKPAIRFRRLLRKRLSYMA